MNSKIIELLKEKPFIIPKSLLVNYKKLNISEEEFIILIYLINGEEKILYNPQIFADYLSLDKYKVMDILNIKVEKNEKGISEEYIYLDTLYNKLFNIIIEEKDEEIDNTDMFSIFEKELGRTLSPMECEIIKEWTSGTYTEELIKEALKEAIYNNVRNLKYIDRILYTWKSKGLNTKEDVIKDKTKFKKSKETTEEVFDYNWLEDE